MSRTRKLLLLASLYLAQGLPFGFFTQALPVVLRERGLSLAAIGATGLLFLPWALKFLWAPVVDHRGNRRSWILSLQLLTLGAALTVALFDPGAGLWPLFLALVLFNFLAATQDVATDGLAVQVLSASERGLGNGLQVGAYRLGMILGGGALLWVYALSGWKMTFWAMAAILALSCLPALLWCPKALAQPPAGEAVSMKHVLAGSWRRLKVPGLASFVVLICLYKLGDAMASSLVSPFMYDAGLAKTEIAVVKGTIGSTMGLLGAALGGWLAWKLGRRWALLGCGVLQTLSLGLYIACGLNPASKELIYLASTAEHLLGSMATVALFTLMMDASEPEQASTDYTLMACAILIAGGVGGVLAGSLGDQLGYAVTFAICCALSGLGCLMLVTGVDAGRCPERIQVVWRHPVRAPTMSG